MYVKQVKHKKNLYTFCAFLFENGMSGYLFLLSISRPLQVFMVTICLISTSLEVFSIDHTGNSGDRNGKDDPEHASEWGTSKHDDEYEEWWEIERLAHDLGDEEIILEELDRTVESDDDDGSLPSDPKSDDKCGDKWEDRSDIWDKFHNTSDKGKGQCFSCTEIKYPLGKSESDIRRDEYTKTENKSRSDPSIADLLDWMVVVREIAISSSRSDTEDEFSDFSPLEYHEKCCHSNEKPIGNDSANSTHDRDTTTCQWWYLTRDDCLDTSCILLDDIESMSYIFLSEYEENDLLDIRIEMKSGNSFCEISLLGRIHPMDHERCRICDIVDHDWNQCPDNDTSEKKNSDIDRNDGHPGWNSIFFALVYEWAHENRQKSRYHNHYHNRREYIEDVQTDQYCEKRENHLDPEWETDWHKKK